MSIFKFLSSLLYTPASNTISLDGINEKLNNYQAALEDLGFTVKRANQMLFFSPAQVLTATRDNLVLEVTMDVTGFEHVTMALQIKGFLNTMPMRLSNFDHALAIAGAKEPAPVPERKIA